MSKKVEAFQLFGQGKRPGDDEIKALGLTAKTTYNYFQEYKKLHAIGNNDAPEFDDIAELKKEETRLTLLTQIDELAAKRARLSDRADKLEAHLDAVSEYLGEILDRVETLASCTLKMLVQLHPKSFDEQALQNWDTYKKTVAAIEYLKNADPIPEKLRKLKPKD